MLRHYAKIAIRNLLRQKVYSIINITGLAIGLAGCILITLFVLQELSYDRFHGKAERIFRVGTKAMVNGISRGRSGYAFVARQGVHCPPPGESIQRKARLLRRFQFFPGVRLSPPSGNARHRIERA
jgi:hypothetical protein